MRGSLTILFLVAQLTWVEGCEDAEVAGCAGGCLEGTVCDHETKRCVNPRPPECPRDLGRYLSLAVDSAGNRIFACYTRDYGDLVVGAIKPDDSLRCEYVDGTPLGRNDTTRGDPTTFLLGDDVGLYASLALDVLDRPHVAYFDRTNQRLKYAHRSGEGWEIVPVPHSVDPDHVVGRACSLSLDSDGLPHIAYLDETEGSLKVARKSSEGRWAVERVTVPVGDDWPGSLGGETGRRVALVLDAEDREWIAYRGVLQGTLLVAGRQKDAWSILELDSGEDTGTWIDAALDADGNMALVYSDRSRGVLKYAWNQEGTLQNTVVDDGSQVTASGARRRHPVGEHCALAFGRDTLPRIVYLHGADLDLKLVQGKREGGFESPQTLDADAAVGFYSDLDRGPDGIHVATCRLQYDDQGQLSASLRYTLVEDGDRRVGGGW